VIAGPRPWRWLVSLARKAAKADCAVCIPPGATLLLRDIPQPLRQEFGLREEEEVTFTQITAAANSYRDAVRFSNGAELLLQRLQEGQRVAVICLEAREPSAARKEASSPDFIGMSRRHFGEPRGARL
jgi:hypothetical protein